MDEIILAYSAGIFDGEGSVSLLQTRRGRLPSPQTSVASNDRELLEWLRLQFHGSISSKKPRQVTHHISYDWKLTDRQALAFLEAIRPYLKIERKKARIDLLLQAYLACTPRNGRYTPEMLGRKLGLIEAFNSLP